MNWRTTRSENCPHVKVLRFSAEEKFMKITQTPFEGLLILEPKILSDSRGHFFESFNRRTYKELGLQVDFVQENQSRSRKNVVRGLHFQKNPYAQSKLVRVLNGRIMDVVVDLRKEQSTFMKSFSMELSSDNLKRLFVPKGFAHGFSVLTDSADVLYHCDEYYHPEFESGIVFNDPSLGIDWGVDVRDCVLSSKDLALPSSGHGVYTF